MTKLAEIGERAASKGDAGALCKDLIEGLHAASQPLTILRATLASPEVKHQSVQEMRKSLRSLSKEVERLCVLFNYLQQFVIVESIQAEPEIEDLHQLTKHALEGVDLLFAKAGVGLTLEKGSEAASYVLVDSSRFEQALHSILTVFLHRAQPGDQLIVKTTAPGTRIDMFKVGALAPHHGMEAVDKLNMALAAANLRSQGAQMAWEEQPFAVRLRLRDASPSATV